MSANNGWNKWQELVLHEVKEHGEELKKLTKSIQELRVNQAVQGVRIRHQAKTDARSTAKIWGTVASAITSAIVYILTLPFK